MGKPVVFKSQGQQVVGMLHMPDRRKGRIPAVVFFHGFTGTKVESHRIFVKMARALAGFQREKPDRWFMWIPYRQHVQP